MHTRRIADALRVRKNGFRVLPLIIFLDRVIIFFQPLRSIAEEDAVAAGARLAVAVQVAIAEEEEEAPEKLSRPLKLVVGGWDRKM